MYITHNVSEASLKSGAWLLPVARILWLCRASSRTYHWWHTDYNNFMSFYFSWDIQSWVSELLSSISCIALLHFYWETMRSHDCSRLLILSECKVWWWNVVELELCLDLVLMKVLEDKSRKVQWTILDIEEASTMIIMCFPLSHTLCPQLGLITLLCLCSPYQHCSLLLITGNMWSALLWCHGEEPRPHWTLGSRDQCDGRPHQLSLYSGGTVLIHAAVVRCDPLWPLPTATLEASVWWGAEHWQQHAHASHCHDHALDGLDNREIIFYEHFFTIN